MLKFVYFMVQIIQIKCNFQRCYNVVLQVVIYKSASDEEKLAAYAKLALPAMEKPASSLQEAFP